jgi:hypothetical protein
MKGLRRKILSFFTTLAMTVGLVFAGPLQTDVQAVNHYTVSFDGTVSDNTVTYTVGGTAVVVNISLNNGGITSSWDVSNEKSLVMNGGADFLRSLSGAVTSITNYDASTMEIVLIGANNFNLVLSYNNGVFSRSGVGGIPDGSHFEIRAKNNNPGGGNGGNPPGGSKTATINMSSTDGDWSGRPAARENTYRYRADGETIDWNYQTDQSYRYCIVSIDNGQRADFFDSATGTVSFNPDPNDTTHVNVTIAHNWAYKVDSIRINNVDYTTQIPDVSVRNTFLQNFSFRYRDQDVSYTIQRVPVTPDGNGNITLTIVANLRPIDISQCYIGNFLWWEDRSGDSEISLIKVQYPDYLGSTVFDEATIAAESRLERNQKTARYLTYGVENGQGEMVLPVGSKVTMRVAPRFGYQVNEFTINGTPLASGQFSPENNIAEFTFTISPANFHLGANVESVNNEVNTDTATGIYAGDVQIGDGDNSMTMGSALLEVEDVAVSGEQAASFEAAAGDYTVENYVDISLYNKINKGSADNAWITQVSNLERPATIAFGLDADVSNKVVLIVHERADGTYETIPTRYIPGDNAIVFETTSFSNYAIAMKDGTPELFFAPDDSDDGAGGGDSGNNTYEGNLNTIASIFDSLPADSDAVIRFNEGNALPQNVMLALSKHPNAKLEFWFIYEDKEYFVVVTGKKMAELYDENIPWYGPLWLNQYFGVQ